MTLKSWAMLLGGLVVWTVHFFALYAIGEAIPEAPFAPPLVIAISLACAAVNVPLFLTLRRRPGLTGSVGRTGAIVSLVAVVWQSLPALL